MARLRQQHPQNYVNSGNIHTEFENTIRYLNAAELGNKTIGELFSILFNEEGVFTGPIQMRVDSQSGLQFRVGMYASETVGWQDLVDIASLRGPSGSNAGTIEGPFFYNRQDYVVTAGVSALAVTVGGSLYTTAPPVSFSGPDDPDGTRPTAVAAVGEFGDITSITIITPGSGYLTAPTVTIAASPSALGILAEATCTLSVIDETASVLAYNFDVDTETVIAYKNGVLLSEITSLGTSEYATDTAAKTVTINANNALALNDKVTIFSIRAQSVTNFRRSDIEVSAATSSVPFVHSAAEKLLVWLNGILQEDGGNADYLSSSAANTITFLGACGLAIGDNVKIITVENQALKTIGGLMLEDEYTDAQGFVKYAKLSIADDEIPQVKVAQLAVSLANKANIIAQSNSPSSPFTKDLWLDISRVPAILKFYDGTQWLETSPESSLPTFVQSNAGQYVRVNGTGTALEYGDIDFSSLVPKTYMGAANGVATLDTAGKLPINQLPETFSTTSLPFLSVWEDSQAAIGNKTYYVARIYKQTIRIDGIAFKLNSGTCTIQLSVDGVAVGPTYAVTTVSQQYELSTVIEIVASSISRRIEIVTTNNAAGNTLEVTLAAATVNV